MQSIPLIGDLSILMRDILSYFGDFFAFVFETPILDWLENLSQGDNWIAELLTDFLSSLIRSAFVVFNISTDTTVASFFLFAGLTLILAVWILHFFIPFV